MGLLLAVVLALLPIRPQEAKELVPGKYCVRIRRVAFYENPSALSDVVRAAKFGEVVAVTGTVQNGKRVWAQCRLPDGITMFIIGTSLCPIREFRMWAKAHEQEEASSGPDLAHHHNCLIEDGGSGQRENLGPAYLQVDKWCGHPEMNSTTGMVKLTEPGRPSWKNDRATMLRVLRDFRKEGGLGEYAAKH